MPLLVLASARPSIQVQGQNLQEVWLELQQDLTMLSEDNQLRFLPGAGHDIQFHQPGAVIKAVRYALQRCAASLP